MEKTVSLDLIERAKKIKLLILDVDGVLTDGKLIIGPSGEFCKTFHVHDGLGIALSKKFGLKTAIITGRTSKMVEFRANELKIDALYQGQSNKVHALDKLQQEFHVNLDEIAYVGDDLIDLPVMTRVGLACAVPNAVCEVKARSHYITAAHGGHGAVRQVIEMILRAQGFWDQIISDYTQAKTFEDIEQ
ncbi:KdsC family phosphatase [Propionispira raffinosivorans]|uniref:KdsC family phosphatase n=1 Tax=Propionispira raffinosivorans TaxID=86959 RepID=UPI00037B5F6A|nr:HAD-IIIA family hydrolase [Propionispira raffinosivorans]